MYISYEMNRERRSFRDVMAKIVVSDTLNCRWVEGACMAEKAGGAMIKYVCAGTFVFDTEAGTQYLDVNEGFHVEPDFE